MAYDPLAELRSAGLIGGAMTPELEQFFGGLSKNEVDVLVSTKERLGSILPDVMAHSADWASPEATQEGFDAAMLCACGLWSGSGSSPAKPSK